MSRRLSSRYPWLLIGLLLWGAACLRFLDLAHTPPGMAFDLTWDLADALRISRGIPFPAVFDTRPEPLFRFLLAGWGSLTGFHVFTLFAFEAFVGVFAVALTYRAALTLLAGQPARHLGALVAAGALAAMMPHVFLSRSTYRAVLVPLVVLLVFILLLRSSRTHHNRGWFAGGFVASVGLHTYLAGILTPFWLLGFWVHQRIFGRPRAAFRQLVLALLALLPLVSLWGLFVLLVPGLFFRVGEAGGSSSLPLLTRLLNGIGAAFQAFFVVGFAQPLYGEANTPFLNPVLAVLALVGLAVAVWRWRHADGALLLGGLLLFIIPAALSVDGTHPVRLVGTMPLIALSAGWGTARLAGWLSRPRQPLLLLAFNSAVIVLLAFSLISTHFVYQSMFRSPVDAPEPESWLSVPNAYMLAFWEALEVLEKVDRPTYVPITALDNPAAMFILQREAFPTVTTLARHPLDELPAGQLYYPEYLYYHTPSPESDYMQGLLLPDENRIIILPLAINKPSADAPQLVSERGWVIARTQDVPARPLDLPAATASANPEIGTGLYLAGTSLLSGVPRAGEEVALLLNWQVTASQPADVFSFAQLIGLDYNAYASSDHHILSYLYPSAYWQPGDLIPDLHILRLPADLPDGVYRWGIGAYVPPGQKRLPINAASASPWPLSNIWLSGSLRFPPPDVNRALPASAQPLDACFEDGISLQGYQIAQSDSGWTLTLYWRAEQAPQGDYTIFVHLMSGEEMIAQQDSQPQAGALPTWSWQPAELIVTTHTLSLPPEALQPDAVYVGLYSFPSLQRLPVLQGGAPSPDNRVRLSIPAG
ncbi:MAG: hypothetical protein JNJ78_03005 [Anaerolineae bacterium]|nr:hypothetical protein [Anaerolineae bacterium]